MSGTSSRMPSQAKKHPATHPATARTKLSVSSWRIRRQRVAPIDAHSNFAVAGGGAGKQQICNIGAGDEEQQCNGSEQWREDVREHRCDAILERARRDAEVFGVFV